MTDYIGEIIESSSTRAIAQTKRNDIAPEFGSFVRIDDENSPIYGIVNNLSTSSIDKNRQTIAYNLPYEELLKQQPQIFNLLKTNFEMVIIGYQKNGTINQSIPPHHPQIHRRVYECKEQDILALTDKFNFLRTIHKVVGNLAPELITACIRSNAKYIEDEKKFLINMGKELSNIYQDDYSTLRSIIQNINL